MNTTTETTSTTTVPATGTRLQRAMRWLDAHTLWAMNPSDTVAARQRLLTEQWSRSTTRDEVVREMVR